MSQLEEATRRLQSALERLDRAVTARANADAAAGVGGGEGVAALRAALSEAEQENAKLQLVATQASERLDAAILRLKDVLEE